MNFDALIEQLKRHEGLKLKLYRCAAGFLTIGYGRNLETCGISEKEAEMMLHNDAIIALENVRQIIPDFENLRDRRQQALTNMCFNLGAKGLASFRKMIDHLSMRRFKEAADEIRNSLYAKQVGQRANEIANMLRDG